MVFKKTGKDCEDNIDGTRTCKFFKTKRNTPYATGTEVNISVDTETCMGQVKGRIMEGDEERVEREVRLMEAKCKKGFRR